jgi:predicted MFS family arabinose efflux permease
MSSLTASAPSLRAVAPARARLSDRAAFALLASLMVSFLAGSAAPTPLYAIYQAAWGFSPITVTVVFGVYALAVLGALLTFGALSDHVGRRPVLIAATALQAITMLVFATAGGVSALLVARILQGLSTGAAAGAVGAGLLDLDRARGTTANAVAPLAGTATGGVVSGLMVQYLPAPTHLVYLALAAVFAAQTVGVVLMADPSSRRPGALASLRPQFRLPSAARGPLLVAAPALVAAWAIPGFFGSLGPTLVRKMTGSHALALGGLTLFSLAGSGALAVLLLRRWSPRALMSAGLALMLGGVAFTLAAVAHSAVAAFFVGTTITGAGFGASFQGAIRSVLPQAEPHQRAGLLSVLYVISYLAMGLPAVIAGARVVYGGGLLATTREYGVVVIALAALALLGTWARASSRSGSSARRS